jgi:WD40 repeat protein
VPSVPLAARVVEVIAEWGAAGVSRYRYGSGCIVRGRTVLTAAHVVAGAASVVVRGPDKREYSATLDPRFVGDIDGPGPDLALLEIDDPAFTEDLPAIGLAAVDRDSNSAEPVERCHVVGYPWFAETRSRTRTAIRDTVDAIGIVPVLSKLAAGLLSVQVSAAPRALPPEDVALAESEWSGMSGAPVVAAGCLFGVVTEHAPREGPSAVAAVPLTTLQADSAHERWGQGVVNPEAWWSRLGVDGIGDLQLLPVPPPPRPEPAYRATLREFGRALHQRMPQLLGRERELEDIAAFATGPRGYRWLVGGAFAGKSALLYEAVTVGLPDKVDVASYFLSRRASDASSDRFLAAVVPQLAYLCDLDPPAANVDQYRALWAQAVARAAQTGRHLLLVVDGLDEDLHPSGSSSVAGLLPILADAHAHVLVTSRPRPELPGDVPDGHPLRQAHATDLDPFKDAPKLAELARQEIHDLTHGDDADLAVEVFGLLTAAAGPLSLMDLFDLKSARQEAAAATYTRHVRRLVEERAARSLERVGPVGDERYQFAHSSLLEYARTDEDLHDPEYRQRIHRWAKLWQDARWPIPANGSGGTPRYLFDSYPASLTADPQRLAALVSDAGWVATAISVAGVDRVLADLRTAATEASSTVRSGMLGVVSTQTTNLRPPQPVDQPAYVLRQLCLQAMEFGEDDFANAARTRLGALSDPGPVPLWTTRRASAALAADLGAHQGGVSAMALGYESMVVTGGKDGRVLAWNASTPGVRPVELGAHRGPVSVMAGLRLPWRRQQVITAGDDGRVLMWDLGMLRGGPIELGTHDGRVSAVAIVRVERGAFGGDHYRDLVVTGGDDGRVLAWNLTRAGKGPLDLGTRQGPVSAMAALPWWLGQVVTGGDDGRVLTWNAANTGGSPVELGAHRGRVSAMAVLDNGQVVTGGDDGQVLAWFLHYGGGSPVELGAHRGRVSAVAVLEYGRVVTGGDDGRVLAWNTARADSSPVELGAHRGQVTAMAVLGDGRVVTGWDDGGVLVWDPDAGPGLIELGAHRGQVSAVAVLGPGQVVTGGDDGQVLVWELSSPEDTQDELGTYRSQVSAVAALGDGRVVTGGSNGSVLVWAPETAPVELGAHRGQVSAVAVLGDGRVVTGGKSPRVLVWDLANAGAGPVKLGTRQGGRVSAVAVLGDGRVVTTGNDGRVLVWDLDRPATEPVDLGPQRKVSPRRHRSQASLWAVAVLGDGRVVTGGDDGQVLVWDPDAPGVGPVMLGAHDGVVRAVTVLGDRRIITGGDDGQVLVWDPNNPGEAPLQLGTHGDWVRAVAVTSGRRVVTSEADRWVVVWDLDTGERVAEIRCSVYGLVTCTPSTRDHTELIIRHGVGLSGWSMPEPALHD